MRICAQAIAEYLKESGLARKGLVIGYDTRFASEDFAQAAAEVISGNKIKVYLCSKATPTPVISYGTIVKRSGGAIVITASHNPPRWNGLKYKSEFGSSAPPEATSRIEEFISQVQASSKIEKMTLERACKEGLLEYLDLAPLYAEQVSRLIELERLRQSGLKVIIDPMYGAGSGYFGMLLNGGSLKLTEINGERNPAFPGIRPEPIAANLKKLSSEVKSKGASIGIATDGDADRVGIIDEKGEFLTQLQVFALLCLYLLEVKGERGALIKTITTTSMIYRLGEIFGVKVYETPVGFKYVAPIMMKENALIGGEESGGYGFRGHIPERDGILAGLYFLDFMLKTGKTPSQLLDYLYSKVGPHYYQRLDIEFPPQEKEKILKRLSDNPPQTIDGVRVVKINTMDGFHFTLADQSWLLIRFSGTEPLLRIYAETDSQARAERLLEEGRRLAGV